MTGDAFLKILLGIIKSERPKHEKISVLLDALVNICKNAVESTGIQFHTLFSIIAYTGHQYSLPGRLLFNIHRFRREAGNISADSDQDLVHSVYNLGLRIICDITRTIYKISIPPSLTNHIPPESVYTHRKDDIVQFKKYQRVLVLGKNETEHFLDGIDQSMPDKKIRIRYHLPDKNELFDESINVLGSLIRFPVEVNLIDVEIDTEGYYLPRAFVIQPDFLIDITTIADCFKGRGITEASHFIKRFITAGSTKYMMLGNIANFFLDELMANPDQNFKDLMRGVFQLNPLAFAQFSDSTVREIVKKAQRHFVSLKIVINQSFKKEGINPADCFLEPTFYSEKYGLQGRLDVLYDDPKIADDAAIVELKSGKPYKTNIYGLNADHYVQTLLYDLLIKSASSDKLKPTNYILYSTKETDHLRFAPAVRSQQYEALEARNRIIAIDHKLSQADRILSQPNRFLEYIKEKTKSLYGYSLRDMEIIKGRYEGLSNLEKKYFLSMVSMIAREHRLSKIGLNGDQGNNGQAGLWLNSLHDKEAQFNILSHLEILENRASESEPMIIFKKTENTNTLANFRHGDLALLYPYRPNKSPLSTQLFKSTIVALSENEITVRLRAKQFNDSLFKKYIHWNLEHDTLDSGFNLLYRSLFHFCAFEVKERQRFLSLRPPSAPVSKNYEDNPLLTEEQNRVMQKILNAEDYFLLWGPPGTGKTNIIVRHLVSHLIKNTGEHLLILAYTNRAVDELCYALKASSYTDFLRIGSRFSTDPNFVENLFGSKVKSITQRAELREIVNKHRIIIGTISSVLGKRELFSLKNFDRIIIDEATQVLEPMLAGLLPGFKNVLLIGDHRQLAAVVAQSKENRSVNDDALRSIELTDLGNSYFERIFRRCEIEQWTWAYDKLSYQGRMHEDVMAFPSQHFYNGMLKTLPGENDNAQSVPLDFAYVADDSVSKLIASKRVLFFPIEAGELFNSKVNEQEAKFVATVLKKIIDLYDDNDRSLDLTEVGIITPYRAQIAQIRRKLESLNIPSEALTVDTVERYQGGSRKIIIISLCVNSLNQLENLVSLSSDNVDRKLNVALTRAKEQVIVIGNPEILRENATYRQFIDDYNVEQIG